jgi:hypothetical protein
VFTVFFTAVVTFGQTIDGFAGQSEENRPVARQDESSGYTAQSLQETIAALKAQLEKQQAQIDKLTTALEEKNVIEAPKPDSSQVASLKPVAPPPPTTPNLLLRAMGLAKESGTRRDMDMASSVAPQQTPIPPSETAQQTSPTPVKPDNTPSIRVGVTLYPSYTYTQSPQSVDIDGNKYRPSNFDVQRSYINVTGNISRNIVFRITPDITRENTVGATASTQNNLLFRIKYAFAQFNLDDWFHNWKQTWIRVGANQTPLIDWEEGVYRYRFQGTTFTERVGTLTSSDYGASFHTMSPGNYIEIHTGVYNGPGYSSTAANEQKAFQTRITYRPFAQSQSVAKGIRVTSFYDWDQYALKDQKRRFVMEGLFEHRHVVAGFDYLDARDQTSAAVPLRRGNGYGVWATPALKQTGKGFEMLLRYDSWTPNRTALTKKQNMSIVGVSYWFPHEGNVATSMLFDWEVVKFPGTSTLTQSRFALHGYLNF